MISMKRLLLVVVAVVFLSGGLLMAEQLDLTAPTQPIADAASMNIRYIQIYPSPNQTIIVHFDWQDASGNKVWDSQLEITGSDFQDVMVFSIRAQDVGTAIGQGLKGLIYNKMETYYGVSFQ